MTCSSAGITSDIPCVDVPACGRGGHDDGGGGALLLNWTTVGEGGGAAPAQQTRARVCWDEHGLAIRAAVDDASLCSPYTSCDDETYVGADVVEVFLTPTKNAPADAPDTYLELDVAPTGALWAGAINDTRGTDASYCTLAAPYCAQFGPLQPCFGSSTFAGGLTAAARNVSEGWVLRFSIPWVTFAPDFQPQVTADGATVPWQSWRLNLYRTDVNAPTSPAADQNASCGAETEQSSWAHVDSHFHDPPKFGYAFLV